MSRSWALVSVAALLLASGCLGSSSAQTQTRNGPSEVIGGLDLHRPYAEFRVRGIYSSCPRTVTGTVNHFGSELCRAHAEFTCLSKKAYMEAANSLPNESLCLAILDYRTQIRFLVGEECNCPASAVRVDVRGAIQGHRIHERITPCMCGLDRQARYDVGDPQDAPQVD
jgi:hypothetical protein